MKKSLLALVLLFGSLLTVHAEDSVVVIDKAASRVNVDVKATVDSFVGQLKDYEAAIKVDPATGAVTACLFKFRMLDVRTGKDKRDRKMNEWQETQKFPDCVFEMDHLEPGEGKLQTAKGSFTFHGVSQSMSVPVTVTREGKRYQFDGEVIIDTQTFGLPIIRMMGVLKVDPKVKVAFHLEGAVKP
jgi:polyisoprenoid-binding protein YceI